MKPDQNRTLFLTTTIFVVIFSLLNPVTVFADDDPPPAPTEEPAQPPTDESPATEEPLVFQEDANVDGILSQVPQETQVVVVHESGQAEPLVTHEAAEIILSGDPIWCKDSVAPDPLDAANCTGSYTSLQDLLDYLALNQPTENGTIWIEDNYDSSVNDNGVTAFTVDGAVLTTWASHSVTIQGGWDGNSGSIVADPQNPSVFNGASLSIINWGNAVTVNNVVVDNAIGDGLTVTTTGDIVLNNVQSNNNTGQGAYLDNTNGSANISLTGKSTFKSNSNLGLLLSSCGVISISNLSADNNGAGAFIGNACSGNAGLEDITLLGKNSFSGNDSFGLFIQSKGNLSLQNISANGNGFFGAVLDNCLWNPNVQACGGTGNIVLNGANIFNGNASGVLAGLNTLSNGRVTLNNLTAIGNSGDGLYLEIGQPSSVNFGCIKNNGGYGIQSYGGTLTLNGVKLNGNSYGDVRILSGTLISNSAGNPCSQEKSGTASSSLPIHYVEITSGQTVELDCKLFSGTVLTLPNGDSAYFPCPLSDSASLTSNTNDSLPGSLPAGTAFGSGFTTLVIENGINQSELGQFVTISFAIPDDIGVSNLAILFWDGAQWIELTDGLQVDEGGKVILGGFVSADSLYFEALVNFTGTFILVQK